MKRILFFIITVFMIGCFMTMSIIAADVDAGSIAANPEWQMLKLINDTRASKGMDKLELLLPLQGVCDIRAQELCDKFSHYRPDGSKWYTAMTQGGVEYNVDSVEIIASNYDSVDNTFKAIMSSASYSRALMGKCAHLGIGYDVNADATRNSWVIIVITCNDTKSLSVCNASDVHVLNGRWDPENEALVETKCTHGKSYIPMDISMIKNYKSDIMGKQVVTVEYDGKSTNVTVINDYEDVERDSWYYNAVMTCTNNRIFSGIGERTFLPSGHMTREMFVTVLGRFAGIDTSDYTDTSFKDVKAGQWYSPYIEWAADMGIVSGDLAGNFNGSKGITRQELCSIVMRYFDKSGIMVEQTVQDKKFNDDVDIAKWARESVSYCVTRGIMAGDTLGNFGPSRIATRAEVAVIMSNIFTITK